MHEGISATPANMRRFQRPNRTLDDGSTLLARQPFAYSPVTDERYSATPGDYWHMEDDDVLRDSEDNPMILVFEVCELVNADKYQEYYGDGKS